MKVKVIKCSDEDSWYYNKYDFPIITQVDSLNGELARDLNNDLYYHSCDCIEYDIKEQLRNYAKTIKPPIFIESLPDKIIKNDDGKERVFESGAKRDSNSNKPFIHNLKGYTRLRFGYHMTKGASKYGDKNWELGMPTDQYLESVDRHLAMYINGDRSEDHLSAIIFGIQGCMINEQKEGIKVNEYFK